MTKRLVYCVDSSSLIEAWGYSYRPKNFPSFWDEVEKLIVEGRFVIPEEVKYEVENDTNALHDWVRTHESLVTDFDRDQETKVQMIMREYPRLISLRKNKGWADPFVVALASCRGHTIVTEEKWSVDPPRIPYVARQLGVHCIDLAAMIEAEGWTF